MRLTSCACCAALLSAIAGHDRSGERGALINEAEASLQRPRQSRRVRAEGVGTVVASRMVGVRGQLQCWRASASPPLSRLRLCRSVLQPSALARLSWPVTPARGPIHECSSALGPTCVSAVSRQCAVSRLSVGEAADASQPEGTMDSHRGGRGRLAPSASVRGRCAEAARSRACRLCRCLLRRLTCRTRYRAADSMMPPSMLYGAPRCQCVPQSRRPGRQCSAVGRVLHTAPRSPRPMSISCPGKQLRSCPACCSAVSAWCWVDCERRDCRACTAFAMRCARWRSPRRVCLSTVAAVGVAGSSGRR